MPYAARIILFYALCASSVGARTYNSNNRHRRIAGGVIAGIVIGVIVLLAVSAICCILMVRHRRAARGGAVATYPPYDNFDSRAGVEPTGLGAGMNPQSIWNDNANTNIGHYAPPAGPPPPGPSEKYDAAGVAANSVVSPPPLYDASEGPQTSGFRADIEAPPAEEAVSEKPQGIAQRPGGFRFENDGEGLGAPQPGGFAPPPGPPPAAHIKI